MMHLVADQAARILEHAVPDLDPGIRWREALGGGGPLEELDVGDPDETTRTFEVLAAGQPFSGWGPFMGSLAHGGFGLLVEVRYAEPNHRYADRLMAADTVRLAHELAIAPTLDAPNCGWGEGLSPIVNFNGPQVLRQPPHFYLLRLNFSVEIDVERNQ